MWAGAACLQDCTDFHYFLMNPPEAIDHGLGLLKKLKDQRSVLQAMEPSECASLGVRAVDNNLS